MDISLEAGLTMFDSAAVYAHGMAEEILGKAIAGRRDKVRNMRLQTRTSDWGCVSRRLAATDFPT